MQEQQISIVARQKFLSRTLSKMHTDPVTINGDVKVRFRGKREVWKVDKGELLYVVRGVQDANDKI